MADPLAVLGAAVGVTSLIIQLADESVKGYHFLGRVMGMPSEYSHIQIRLQIEQQRFLNFALEAGILYTDKTLCSTLQVNRSLLLAILAEIRTAFETVITKNARYVDILPQQVIDWTDDQEPGIDLIQLLCLPPQTGQSNVKRLNVIKRLGKGMSQGGRNLRTIITEPKRLVWAASDQREFEGLVTKLVDLNSFLISLLSGSQIRRLQDAMDLSYQEIIHVRNDIKSLTILLQALNLRVNTPTKDGKLSSQADPTRNSLVDKETEEQGKKLAYLKRLTELKIQYTQLGSENTDFLSKKEPLLGLDFGLGVGTELDPSFFSGRSNCVYEGKSAWVEWKDTTFHGKRLHRKEILEQDKMIENRIRLLAELLCDEKPTNFHAPPCLGYVKMKDDEDEQHYGIVFSNAGTATSGIQTLYDLLQAQIKPSLSVRASLCLSLAESLHAFHSLSWLHKGIQSHNILFTTLESGGSDLNNPFVSGFDLSRPSEWDKWTEKPNFDPVQDIYRHPLAQSSQHGIKFKKSFDLYALAIILIEIAHWKRIETVIGFRELSKTIPPELRGVKARLLDEPEHLSEISTAFGDAVARSVETLLTTDQFEEEIGKSESETSVAMQLQSILGDTVIRFRRLRDATMAEEIV